MSFGVVGVFTQGNWSQSSHYRSSRGLKGQRDVLSSWLSCIFLRTLPKFQSLSFLDDSEPFYAFMEVSISITLSPFFSAFTDRCAMQQCIDCRDDTTHWLNANWMKVSLSCLKQGGADKNWFYNKYEEEPEALNSKQAQVNSSDNSCTGQTSIS